MLLLLYSLVWLRAGSLVRLASAGGLGLVVVAGLGAVVVVVVPVVVPVLVVPAFGETGAGVVVVAGVVRRLVLTVEVSTPVRVPVLPYVPDSWLNLPVESRRRESVLAGCVCAPAVVDNAHRQVPKNIQYNLFIAFSNAGLGTKRPLSPKVTREEVREVGS
jgi:hypothetical protein